jgi:hypothetical protein
MRRNTESNRRSGCFSCIEIVEICMEVRRTLPVKLVVADSDRNALLETIDQYKHCANAASDHCWNETDYKTTAKYAVKDDLYHDVNYPTLLPRRIRASVR